MWWWALPFVLGFAAWAAMPQLPIPSDMDLLKFMGSDTGQDFFSGAWGWFGVIVALAVFNTVLGEELLFRGLLLPRMRAAFGKRDWVANGAIFALYHLHMPWLIVPTFVDRHLPERVSLTKVPERVDGDHRPLESERAPRRAVSRARAQLAVAPEAQAIDRRPARSPPPPVELVTRTSRNPAAEACAPCKTRSEASVGRVLEAPSHSRAATCAAHPDDHRAPRRSIPPEITTSRGSARSRLWP